MAKPLSALLAAGFSAVLIAVAASAHAAPAPIADPADEAAAMQQKQAEENMNLWAKIADRFCGMKGEPINPQKDLEGSRKQFSDEGIRAYDKAYKLSPLEYYNDRHPADEARRALMGKDSKYAPPLGATDADRLRQWRYLLCSSAEFKRDWANAYKTYEEQLGTKMKPGMDEEDKILDLYDEKMDMMLKVLAKEEGEEDDSED
ncbi:hypothetical protein [Nocardia brasiliensis]|uniref:hypothetical protein n=1 Tax=Nocardia brasiliensis TaxID=37326 RepID=UPI003672DA6E